MPRVNKVESSPHYTEILEKLSEGMSGRKLSDYLKNKYGEEISFNALNRYRAKHIKMEARVEAELNRRAKNKSQKKKSSSKKRNEDKSKEVLAKTENEVQRQADIKEEAEETVNTVSETIATNMEGVAKVAAQLPERFEQACRDAENDESKVSSKDLARLALDANKLYNEYFKQDETNFELNLNEGFEELEDALKRSRELAEKS